eukprot:7865870-Pyramimonas_sp.AAC.1
MASSSAEPACQMFGAPSDQPRERQVRYVIVVKAVVQVPPRPEANPRSQRATEWESTSDAKRTATA